MTTPNSAPDKDYVSWLVSQSMLHNARIAARKYAGQSRLWQRPYAHRPPARRNRYRLGLVHCLSQFAIITAEGKSILGDAW